MGVNIPKLISSAFAKYGKAVGDQPATLVKVTPGTRTPGAVSAGTNPTTQNFQTHGIEGSLTSLAIAGTLIVGVDAVVQLFGDPLGSVQPAPNDKILFGGLTLTIVDKGVTSDPVRAMYVCQCRK